MLGIDVSKDTLACTLLDPQTQKPIWNRTVPNTTAGINRLLRLTPDQSHWALEPTGRYSLLAATTARQAGRQVLLAQPKKARDFLRSIQSRAKTDALDSYGIGFFALCRPLPPYPLKSSGAPWADGTARSTPECAQKYQRLLSLLRIAGQGVDACGPGSRARDGRAASTKERPRPANCTTHRFTAGVFDRRRVRKSAGLWQGDGGHFGFPIGRAHLWSQRSVCRLLWFGCRGASVR